MERNNGLRAALTVPRIYELTQMSLYRRGTHAARARDLFPGLGTTIRRVLDIGSGPAAFLAQYRRFAEFDYVGIDPSEAYIATARRRFPGRGDFIVGTTMSIDGATLGSFDLVVADGVLHHVSDDEARSIARFARDRLAPDGRFVTFDPVRIAHQNPIAVALMRMDRGARIRTSDEYRALVAPAFDDTSTGTVVHGRLRMPYDHYESVSFSFSPATSATT